MRELTPDTFSVHYEIKKKAKFVPIALLDSSDEDSDEDGPAAARPPAAANPAGALAGSTAAVGERPPKRRAFSLLTSSEAVPHLPSPAPDDSRMSYSSHNYLRL